MMFGSVFETVKTYVTQKQYSCNIRHTAAVSCDKNEANIWQ